MYEVNIKWLKDISDHEVLDVGYKAHILSELFKANFTVPRGFVINYKNNFTFLQKNNLKKKISEKITEIDFENKDSLLKKSTEIKELILKQPFETEFISDILKMYTKLGESKVGFMNTKVDEYIAIRASISSEVYPLKELDVIEKQIGFLNIKGRDNLLTNIKKCWADFYSPEILEYTKNKNFDLDKINLSIIVQKMIPGKKSGIVITSKEENKDLTIIEAILGFGGKSLIKILTPDHYEISKKTLTTIKKTKSNQEWMLKRLVGKTTKISIDEKELLKQKLNQRDLNELTEIAKKLELIYGITLEINWVIDSNEEIYLISVSPNNPDLKKIKKKKTIDITTYQEKMDSFKKEKILEGIGVSNGISIGTVKIIKSKKDLEDITENTILVTKMTTLEMSQTLRKAKGIITDAGSTICHAALISQKYDVPCVVHTERATEILKDGQSILLNGFNGKIYSVSGYVAPRIIPEKKIADFKIEKNNDKGPSFPKTITKTIINLKNIEEVKKVNLSDIDGILINIDSLLNDYQKGTILENINLLVSTIKNKLTALINILDGKEIFYKINTHERNLISENVSSYELEAIIELKGKINILLENIKSADEISSLKKATECKIGILIESLKENVVLEYFSRGAEYIIFNIDEIDSLKIKEIVKICKENKIERFAEINSKNTVSDLKTYIDLNINGLIINKENIEYKDLIYKKERELLKNLLSV
jgi:pyruvate, water dikinase